MNVTLPMPLPARRLSGSRLADCRATGSALLLQRAVKSVAMRTTLKTLLKGLAPVRVEGRLDTVVEGLATDSRRVNPGYLFFALPGLRTDGSRFIDEAIDRGARVVVSQQDTWVPPGVVLVLVEDVRGLLAKVAARFHGDPARELELTGILGTSGKTVTGHLLRHFLTGETRPGLLGTLQYAVGKRTLPAHRTTPEPIELHGLFRQMREEGCERAILEVSSHAIHQRRVEGLRPRQLLLLNLTAEHLHYHGSQEAYVALHRAYLEERRADLRRLIVGLDDLEVRQLVKAQRGYWEGKLLTFGQSADADIRAEDIQYNDRDTRFTLVWPEGRVKVCSPLLGSFNVENVLAAVACGYAEGIDPVRMGAALLSFPGVRGRMERVDEGQAFTVLVDYMHTEAAYEKGLEMVRTLTDGRLITVFGCGGDRDPAMRPVITRAVARASDLAIATADNPRGERLEEIFQDMRSGNAGLDNLQFIEDRRAAISAAMEAARPGDIVLIAGKGHETFQEFADCVVPFDDCAVARELIRNRGWVD